ncbi:MAG: hypothetical protein IKO75_07950 [Bacteroidales bacterium]|nr:hypothetical protein [Bacteroidales bacterium]
MKIKTSEEFIKESYIGKENTKDDIFDLEKIPMSILDKGWKRYNPYLLKIDHRHPLSTRRVCEGTDYLEQITKVKDIITSTFPISEEQFVIVEGNHGLYAALLIAVTDNNIEIIEESMRTLGFFRSKPTDKNLLVDRKKRKWIDMRFEPSKPDDVTETIYAESDIVYHAAPVIFKEKILKNGLKPSNDNPEYQYSEERVFLSEGTATEEDLQALVDSLYGQAAKKNIPNLTDIYAIFVVDLKKLNELTHFYYDINEPKGIYTTTEIPPSAISYLRTMKAKPLPPQR